MITYRNNHSQTIFYHWLELNLQWTQLEESNVFCQSNCKLSGSSWISPDISGPAWRIATTQSVPKDERGTMSGFKTPAVYSRTGNGAKPKSRICRLTSSRSLISSLVGDTLRRSPEVTESSSSSPSKSPRRTCDDRKSPRRYSEERQPAHHSPKSRRYLPSLDEDSFRDEMGLGLRVSSTTSTCVDEGPGMSFLEFETLYILEKEMLMQTQCSQDPTAQLDDKCVTEGCFGGRKGVYTELPDPLLCHQVSSAIAPVSNSQIPTEGFSFAPGWSLNADHFYQWQHRGKTTQQVVYDRLRNRALKQEGKKLTNFRKIIGQISK